MHSRARRIAVVPIAIVPIAIAMCLALLVSMGLPRRASAQEVPAQEPAQKQSGPVRRSAFNTIGLTAFWRADKTR